MSKSTIALRIYIIRHGETQENRKGIIQGQKDTELNEIGLRQASMLGEALKNFEFGFAFSSDLGRALNTAKAIMRYRDGVKLVIDPALRERAMGYLEGRALKELDMLDKSKSDAIELGPAFSKRLTAWWNRTILQSVLSRSKDDKVSHVLLVQQLLGSRKVKAVKGVENRKCMNASITVIDVERSSRRGHLVAFGDVRHLVEMEALEAGADMNVHVM